MTNIVSLSVGSQSIFKSRNDLISRLETAEAEYVLWIMQILLSLEVTLLFIVDYESLCQVLLIEECIFSNPCKITLYHSVRS